MCRPQETSLLSSERLFRTTYERAVIGIAHVSAEGRWLRFNQRLCDLLGYSCEELAARTYHDITHPDDHEASDAYFQRLLAGELDAYELDKRYIRKDGAPIWVHLTVSLVRTPEGAPEYTLSMVQDITEHKRLEREREEALARATASEAQATERAERLHTILETMADGVVVYDQEGHIIQCNRAYRTATGAAPGRATTHRCPVSTPRSFSPRPWVRLGRRTIRASAPDTLRVAGVLGSPELPLFVSCSSAPRVALLVRHAVQGVQLQREHVTEPKYD